MSADLSATPALQTGDNLTRAEFLRIWEQLPHIKRAELIGGIVYVPLPQSVGHGRADRLVSTWLGVYELHTPGCTGGDNTTSLIGADCPQPDSYLAILPQYGGKSWATKYVEGTPELIAEISLATVSIDLHQKLDAYEAAGVPEYFVVLLAKRAIRWQRLVKGKYRLLRPDPSGVYRSRVFPGLWLDSEALFDNDLAAMLAKLQEGLDSSEHKRSSQDWQRGGSAKKTAIASRRRGLRRGRGEAPRDRRGYRSVWGRS